MKKGKTALTLIWLFAAPLLGIGIGAILLFTVFRSIFSGPEVSFCIGVAISYVALFVKKSRELQERYGYSDMHLLRGFTGLFVVAHIVLAIVQVFRTSTAHFWTAEVIIHGLAYYWMTNFAEQLSKEKREKEET